MVTNNWPNNQVNLEQVCWWNSDRSRLKQNQFGDNVCILDATQPNLAILTNWSPGGALWAWDVSRWLACECTSHPSWCYCSQMKVGNIPTTQTWVEYRTHCAVSWPLVDSWLLDLYTCVEGSLAGSWEQRLGIIWWGDSADRGWWAGCATRHQPVGQMASLNGHLADEGWCTGSNCPP